MQRAEQRRGKRFDYEYLVCKSLKKLTVMSLSCTISLGLGVRTCWVFSDTLLDSCCIRYEASSAIAARHPKLFGLVPSALEVRRRP